MKAKEKLEWKVFLFITSIYLIGIGVTYDILVRDFVAVLPHWFLLIVVLCGGVTFFIGAVVLSSIILDGRVI